MPTNITPLTVLGQDPIQQIGVVLLVAVPYAVIWLIDRATGRHLRNGFWRVVAWTNRRSRWITPTVVLGLTAILLLGKVPIIALALGGPYVLFRAKLGFDRWHHRHRLQKVASDPEKYALPWHVDQQADSVDDRHYSDVVSLDATRTLFLLGQSGSGKSELMKHILYQLLLRDPAEPMAVFDRKGEFREFFDNHGVPYLRLSGQDSGVKWNIFHEVRPDHAEADLEELSRSMFPDALRGDFFSVGARQVFTSVLKHLYRQGERRGHQPTNADLVRFFVTQERQDVYDILSNYEDMAAARSVLDPDASKQSAGVYATLQQQVEDFFVEDFAKEGSFSVREYVDDPQGAVLLIEYPEFLSDSVRPVYRVILDWMIRFGIDADPHSTFLLDEFASIPHVKRMGELMNVGRGSGATAVGALQSIGQLESNYGDEADEIKAGWITQIGLGVNDNTSKDHIMEIIGEEWESREKPSRNWQGEVTGTKDEQYQRHPFASSEPMSWDKGHGVVVRPGESWIFGWSHLITARDRRIYEKAAGRGIPDFQDQDEPEQPAENDVEQPETTDPPIPDASADGGEYEDEPDARGNR